MQSHYYPFQQYNKNSLIWYNQFEELLEYKKQYGRCNVPSTYENHTLSQWVNQQRDDYAKLKMSDERINKLNTIGFNWGVSIDKSWTDKFEELKQYKSKYGDCKVPSRYNKNQPLATWVQRQRSQFKHSKMSEERISMLNSIGFSWRVYKNSLWIDKFEELKLYKSKHGDCNVPVRYDENQMLANWVHLQRSYLKNSKLSKKCISMLNGIGFSWTAPKRIVRLRQLKNHEQITSETSYQDSNKQEELAFSNKIDTEQEEDYEPIVIETSYHDQKEKEITNKEKGDNSFKTSLQDRVQVLSQIERYLHKQDEIRDLSAPVENDSRRHEYLVNITENEVEEYEAFLDDIIENAYNYSHSKKEKSAQFL